MKPIPADIEQEALGQVASSAHAGHIETNNQSHQLTCMSLGGGRKPEYPERKAQANCGVNTILFM